MQNPDYLPYQKRKVKPWVVILAIVLAGAALSLLAYQIPRVNRAVSYRIDIAQTYIHRLLNPISELPTPAVQSSNGAAAPAVTTEKVTQDTQQPSPTAQYTPTATLVPTPIPNRVQLDPPAYDEEKDKQDWNNCGPATLALYLRYFGWDGNQFDISDVIKPTRDDRNVNVEELVYYVWNYTGWLDADFRVGGDLETLKKFIAAGIPVMIEETFQTDRKYWPEDDRWAGHYLLVTGYDDGSQTFTVHDSEVGPNQTMSYSELYAHWESFNYVYIYVYPFEREADIQQILGPSSDVTVNRQLALEKAQSAVESDPENAFAWFNIGTNLVFFERYKEATEAYNKARMISLPQRMLRYQFGPFISYFHSLQTEELMALTKYALEITRTSEEAMLWRGWGEYRMGNSSTALNYFRDALRIRPDYIDAQYAIDFVTEN